MFYIKLTSLFVSYFSYFQFQLKKKVKTDIRQFEKQGIDMEEQRKRILKELEQKQQDAKQSYDRSLRD